MKKDGSEFKVVGYHDYPDGPRPRHVPYAMNRGRHRLNSFCTEGTACARYRPAETHD